MKVQLGGHNNIYTKVFAIDGDGVGTLAISGVLGFDLTDDSLDNIWDTTASKAIPCKRVTLALSHTAGQPVWTYTFYSLPTGVLATDTLVITLNIPDTAGVYMLEQYEASKV